MQGEQFVFDLKKLHQNEKTEEKAADTTPARDTKKSDDAATSPQSAQLRDESPASAQAKKVVAATEMVREFAVVRDTEKGLARERLVSETESLLLLATEGKDGLRSGTKALRIGKEAADMVEYKRAFVER